MMPGCRRSHRKSRLGCKSCKTRRVKCDEIHPVCGPCRKQDMKCDFDIRSKSRNLVTLPRMKMPILNKSNGLELPQADSFRTPEALSSASLCSSQNLQQTAQESRPSTLWAMTMNTPQDRLLEHRLMHHYTTTVSATLVQLFGNRKWQAALKRDIFSRWVTNLALSTPGLMDALLSFSAFNLRKLQGDCDKDLNLASHIYLTAAIKAHSEQLDQGISGQNAEILFAGSTLIAFVAISSHEYLSDDDSTLPLHWFQPWQGVRSIVKTTWGQGHIRSEDILALLKSERKAIRLDLATLPSACSKRFEFLLEGLDRSATDPEVLEAYETSVNWLSLLEEIPGRDYCFKFTAQAPTKLVQLLAENDPRTLTIVGYFFMVFHGSESLWWLPRTTGREFRILMEMLPEEWRPRMAMAAKVFEGCDEPKFQLPARREQSDVTSLWYSSAEMLPID